MEIDDSTPYFNRNLRHFPSSDTFKHTLTEMNFTPPDLESSRQVSEFDLDSVKVSVKISDDDTYLGDVTSQYGDEQTVATTPGRSISPDSTAIDDDITTIGT